MSTANREPPTSTERHHALLTSPGRDGELVAAWTGREPANSSPAAQMTPRPVCRLADRSTPAGPRVCGGKRRGAFIYIAGTRGNGTQKATGARQPPKTRLITRWMRMAPAPGRDSAAPRRFAVPASRPQRERLASRSPSMPSGASGGSPARWLSFCRRRRSPAPHVERPSRGFGRAGPIRRWPTQSTARVGDYPHQGPRPGSSGNPLRGLVRGKKKRAGMKR